MVTWHGMRMNNGKKSFAEFKKVDITSQLLVVFWSYMENTRKNPGFTFVKNIIDKYFFSYSL